MNINNIQEEIKKLEDNLLNYDSDKPVLIELE